MALLPVKNSTEHLAQFYGVGPHFVLAMTLVGQGAGKAPIVAAVQDATNPPGAIEVTTTFVSTGVITLTFSDCYYAVLNGDANIDDVGNTPMIGTLGQWANLQTSTPATCVLSTYNASFVAADVALNTAVRLLIVFKKDGTGAAA